MSKFSPDVYTAERLYTVQLVNKERTQVQANQVVASPEDAMRVVQVLAKAATPGQEVVLYETREVDLHKASIEGNRIVTGSMSPVPLNVIMHKLDIRTRYNWCDKNMCLCVGCVNRKVDLPAYGFTQQDWVNWVVDHPEEDAYKKAILQKGFTLRTDTPDVPVSILGYDKGFNTFKEAYNFLRQKRKDLF